MQTVTELLSETKRKVLYLVYGFVGVAIGATQTAYVAAEAVTPLWVTVALSVYAYIGVSFGLVAAQNVGAAEVVVSEPLEDDGTYEVEFLEIEDNLGNHGVIEGDEVFDTEPEEQDFSEALTR